MLNFLYVWDELLEKLRAESDDGFVIGLKNRRKRNFHLSKCFIQFLIRVSLKDDKYRLVLLKDSLRILQAEIKYCQTYAILFSANKTIDSKCPHWWNLFTPSFLCYFYFWLMKIGFLRTRKMSNGQYRNRAHTILANRFRQNRNLLHKQ